MNADTRISATGTPTGVIPTGEEAPMAASTTPRSSDADAKANPGAWGRGWQHLRTAIGGLRPTRTEKTTQPADEPAARTEAPASTGERDHSPETTTTFAGARLAGTAGSEPLATEPRTASTDLTIEDLAAQLAQLRNQTRELTTDNARLQARLTHVEREHADLRWSKLSLQHQVVELTRQLDRYNAASHQQDAVLDQHVHILSRQGQTLAEHGRALHQHGQSLQRQDQQLAQLGRAGGAPGGGTFRQMPTPPGRQQYGPGRPIGAGQRPATGGLPRRPMPGGYPAVPPGPFGPPAPASPPPQNGPVVELRDQRVNAATQPLVFSPTLDSPPAEAG
jgi:hypothetical protein